MMYDVYDYGVVTHTHTHTRIHAHTRSHARTNTTYDNFPREICDNLPQRHFFICNRIIAAMFKILIFLTSPGIR